MLLTYDTTSYETSTSLMVSSELRVITQSRTLDSEFDTPQLLIPGPKHMTVTLMFISLESLGSDFPINNAYSFYITFDYPVDIFTYGFM